MFDYVLNNAILDGISYLVSSSATAKTEPVTPFSFREIHAVFSPCHSDLLPPDAGKPFGATMNRFLLLHVSPVQKENLL